MIKKVSISVCDKCDTVSFAPEYSPCPNCGMIMTIADFVRQSSNNDTVHSPNDELKENKKVGKNVFND